VPREALPGGPRSLTVGRTIRLLACEFEIATDCATLEHRLDSLVPHAAQSFPVSRRHCFDAHQTGDGGYQLEEDGRPLAREPDASVAARTLFWRMHELVLRALPDCTVIHAGCATRGERRFLAAGAAQAGKSTLMARLLYEGFQVHCDDLVLLHRGEALPYPRRFFIRPDSVALIPQLATQAVDAFEWGGWEPGSLALDPSLLGFEWRIERAPIDAVIFLERGPDGRARLERCPKYAMAARLMSQSNQPAGGPRDWIREICGVVDRTECFVLRSGDLEASVSAVKGIFDGSGR
jgi:hypothetical protein